MTPMKVQREKVVLKLPTSHSLCLYYVFGWTHLPSFSPGCSCRATWCLLASTAPGLCCCTSEGLQGSPVVLGHLMEVKEEIRWVHTGLCGGFSGQILTNTSLVILFLLFFLLLSAHRCSLVLQIKIPISLHKVAASLSGVQFNITGTRITD